MQATYGEAGTAHQAPYILYRSVRPNQRFDSVPDCQDYQLPNYFFSSKASAEEGIACQRCECEAVFRWPKLRRDTGKHRVGPVPNNICTPSLGNLRQRVWNALCRTQLSRAAQIATSIRYVVLAPDVVARQQSACSVGGPDC